MAKLPLAGLKVAEIIGPDAPVELVISANMAGKIVQDLGGEVVRICVTGSHQPEPEVDAFLNTGKKLVRAKQDEFLAQARVLCKDIDCVVTDIGTEALLGADVIAPRAVLSMAIDSPLEGNEFVLAARAGLLDLVGDPNRQPLRIGGHQIPYAGGLACYSAMLDMLAGSSLDDQPNGTAASGHTRRIDLLDVAVWLNWKTIGAASIGLPVPTRRGDLGMWRIVPCKDGHLALVYRSGDWKKLTALLSDDRLQDPKFETDQLRRQNLAELNAIFVECFAALTRAQVREMALEHKLPLGPVYTLAELVDDPHMQSRDFFQLISTPDGDRLVPSLPVKWNGQTLKSNAPSDPYNQDDSASQDPKTFGDCRVLDLGIITAGAATSAILADLGADVIKIEGPVNADPFRYWDGPLPENSPPGVPPYFRMTNRGKRNLVLDLKNPDARDVFLEMVKKSDVVVENFRRGVLDSWGLGYDVLKRVNPNIILASISSQGETGPHSKYVSFGNTLEAMGGLAATTGYSDGVPVVTGADFNYPDQVVAIFAASMIQTAIFAKKRGSGATHLDLSQRELTTFLCGDSMLGESAKPRGNSQAGMLAQDCYKSADKEWIAVSVKGTDAAALAQQGCTDVEMQLARWIAERSTADVLGILHKAGIAAEKVLTGTQVLEQHTVSWSRAMARDKEGFLVKGVLFESVDRPQSLDRPAAAVGALSAQILGEHSGLTGEKLDELLQLVGAKAVA